MYLCCIRWVIQWCTWYNISINGFTCKSLFFAHSLILVSPVSHMIWHQIFVRNFFHLPTMSEIWKFHSPHNFLKLPRLPEPFFALVNVMHQPTRPQTRNVSADKIREAMFWVRCHTTIGRSTPNFQCVNPIWTILWISSFRGGWFSVPNLTNVIAWTRNYVRLQQVCALPFYSFESNIPTHWGFN